MNTILKIKPAIKEYDWGNNYFIPELLGTEKTDTPQAELWMGAHKSGICTIENSDMSLRDFLDANPDFAGCRADDFPILFKVLAIEKPLSIQCHPNKEQAKKGFEENNPNYSDPNEKAEMYYALSETSLLCGFRKQPVQNEETENLHRYFESFYPGDKACDYAYKLNLVHLEPGEAVFLKPGIPHAYLSGNGIELMTNSDNVLRLGLTKKRVDPKELYKIMNQSAYEPNLLGSFEDKGGLHFFTPADFVLTVMQDGFFRYEEKKVKILICTDGNATINEEVSLKKGEVCIVAKNQTIDVEVDGTVFCAD